MINIIKINECTSLLLNTFTPRFPDTKGNKDFFLGGEGGGFGRLTRVDKKK